MLRRFVELPWPGNVRELRNVVERLLLLTRGRRVDLGIDASTIYRMLARDDE